MNSNKKIVIAAIVMLLAVFCVMSACKKNIANSGDGEVVVVTDENGVPITDENGEAKLLLEFSKDVLLISGTYGSDVDDIFMSALRSGGLRKEGDLLAEVITILGVKNVPTKRGTALISDLYVQPPGKLAVPAEFEAMFEFLRDNRALRWEDEMERLLNAQDVTSAAVKKALPRNRAVADFLLSRRNGMKQSVGEAV